MWFDIDSHKSRKRGRMRSSNKGKVLRFSARPSKQRGIAMGKIALVIVAVLLLGLAVAGTWWGLIFAGRALFSENPYYTIRKVEIHEGAIITADLVREYTRITEGMNIFSMNIGAVRRAVLEKSPNIKRLEIRRELPDVLRVEVIERTPVATLGRRSSLAVDVDGHVFNLRSGQIGLPVLLGYAARNVQPGKQLTGNVTAALQVLRLCEDPALGLEVAMVDLSNSDYLILHLDRQDKVIKLAWPDMYKDSTESRRKLAGKLGQLSRLLHTPRGQMMRRLDATLDGRVDAY